MRSGAATVPPKKKGLRALFMRKKKKKPKSDKSSGAAYAPPERCQAAVIGLEEMDSTYIQIPRDSTHHQKKP